MLLSIGPLSFVLILYCGFSIVSICRCWLSYGCEYSQGRSHIADSKGGGDGGDGKSIISASEVDHEIPYDVSIEHV